MNRQKHLSKTSKYKGVSLGSSGSRWRAMIQADKKGISLGYFESETDAAKADFDIRI